MAGSLTKDRIHTGNKVIQNIKGNKRLNRSGKTAAMDTVGTPASQIMLTQGEGHSHILVSLVAGGNDILQIHVGRVTTLLDKSQEFFEIAFL